MRVKTTMTDRNEVRSCIAHGLERECRGVKDSGQHKSKTATDETEGSSAACCRSKSTESPMFFMQETEYPDRQEKHRIVKGERRISASRLSSRSRTGSDLVKLGRRCEVHKRSDLQQEPR